jgi:16S rRNA (cytosine967-C5)-methyltransferase
MTVHRLLAEAAASLADAVFRHGKVLDHELAAAFARHPRWGKRDRAFIAETVFEVVRWRRALAFVGDVPDTATASLCAVQWRRMGLETPAWWPHDAAPAAVQEAREAALPDQPRAVRESVPDWLDAAAEAELGPAWEPELAALNRKPRVFLRVNTLRNDRAQAVAWLADQGVAASPVPDLPDALVLPEGKTLPKPLRASGRVEIQDAASQRIAPLLGARPGEVVVDACCGAGGKALHLAALLGNQGVVHALDVEPRKLDELTRRAGIAGAACLRIAPATPERRSALAGRADRLLLDAPCSGLGTLKRQPDLKWRLTPDRLDHVRRVQREILADYPAMLRRGGTLVYATCSILPSENRNAVLPRVEAGDFAWIAEEAVSPARTGWDGFHAVVLEKR